MDLVWTRRYVFQAVHRLDLPRLRERLHGHEFFLEVSFTGSIDHTDLVVKPVIDQLHGHDLGFLVSPTGERLVDWIHGELSLVMGERLRAVAIQETRKNRFVSALSERKYV